MSIDSYTTRAVTTMTRRLCLAVVLISALAVPAAAQSGYTWPYQNYDGAYIVQLSLPTICPPLSTSMPYDVLMGYVGGDSIARSVSLGKCDSLLRVMTWSDTTRQALKYIYEMTDYDPIRLALWSGRTVNGSAAYDAPYKADPGVLLQRFIDRAIKISSDSLLPTFLISDFIARVHVEATQTKPDSTTMRDGPAEYVTLVTSTIMDPIKGQQVPGCWIDSRSKRSNQPTVASVVVAHAEGSHPAVPGACLQFEVATKWHRVNKGYTEIPHVRTNNRLEDSTLDQGISGRSGPWIQPGNDYIVLLRFSGLGGDTQYDYTTILPITWFGTCCSLYPIIDGKVYDPYNDFGFGSNLTVEQFAADLREKIYSITHP